MHYNNNLFLLFIIRNHISKTSLLILEETDCTVPVMIAKIRVLVVGVLYGSFPLYPLDPFFLVAFRCSLLPKVPSDTLSLFQNTLLLYAFTPMTISLSFHVNVYAF
ncbi:unnamed protein product [Lupinus luteus]|uniref:Uncharacterized protein n=1 Tax=Lupinus luteus TaxID=3873 RepID=A0AAV1X0N6_LUPLU